MINSAASIIHNLFWIIFKISENTTVGGLYLMNLRRGGRAGNFFLVVIEEKTLDKKH